MAGMTRTLLWFSAYTQWPKMSPRGARVRSVKVILIELFRLKSRVNPGVVRVTLPESRSEADHETWLRLFGAFSLPDGLRHD